MARWNEDPEFRLFGGNPKIVAEISEIERVAQSMRLVAELIESSKATLAVVWIQDPGQLLLVSAIVRDLERILRLSESLAADCDLAARAYLAAEARVIGIFARYSDSFPLGANLRVLINSGLGGTALGGIGTPLGTLALRTMATTAIANHAGPDVPELTRRLTATVAGTGLTEIPESATVSRVAEFQSSCPTDTLQLAQRLTELGRQETPQIRLDVMSAADDRILFIYLPGTQNWTFGSDNPLDMQSNILAMSGPGLAASEAAAVAALRAVKFNSGDKVILIGHSQGGLVAKNLAAAYPNQVRGIVTFGAPILASELSPVPALVFEHTNDPVPALAGADPNYPKSALTVSRQFPDSSGTQSHHMVSYLATARRLRNQQTPEFVAMERRLFSVFEQPAGQNCQSVLFGIRREGGAGESG